MILVNPHFILRLIMDKKRAIEIITECARDYQKNLEGRDILFVYGNVKYAECIRVRFTPETFMHLTGLRQNKLGLHVVFANK